MVEGEDVLGVEDVAEGGVLREDVAEGGVLGEDVVEGEDEEVLVMKIVVVKRNLCCLVEHTIDVVE